MMSPEQPPLGDAAPRGTIEPPRALPWNSGWWMLAPLGPLVAMFPVVTALLRWLGTPPTPLAEVAASQEHFRNFPALEMAVRNLVTSCLAAGSAIQVGLVVLAGVVIARSLSHAWRRWTPMVLLATLVLSVSVGVQGFYTTPDAPFGHLVRLEIPAFTVIFGERGSSVFDTIYGGAVGAVFLTATWLGMASASTLAPTREPPAEASFGARLAFAQDELERTVATLRRLLLVLYGGAALLVYALVISALFVCWGLSVSPVKGITAAHLVQATALASATTYSTALAGLYLVPAGVLHLRAEALTRWVSKDPSLVEREQTLSSVGLKRSFSAEVGAAVAILSPIVTGLPLGSLATWVLEVGAS